MKFWMRLGKDRRGAAMVEYGLLVAGIALMTSAATSVLGHKATDLMASMAAILPGAHADDNGPITSARLIETTDAAAGPIAVDAAGIVANAGTERLATNLGIVPADLGALVVEP